MPKIKNVATGQEIEVEDASCSAGGDHLYVDLAGTTKSLVFLTSEWSSVPELPTKRDAIVEINGESYWLSNQDFISPWVGQGLGDFTVEELHEFIDRYDGFTVIFEGRE